MTNELAILRRLAEISGRPFTVGEVADLHGLPGPWTVRRLEKRGVVPAVRRSLAHGDRFYPPEDVDWERGSIKIQRTLQRTAGALVFTEPKTASSRRTIPLGASTMKALQRHRVGQAEERLGYGLGKAAEEDLVFATETGTPVDAGNFLRRTHYPLLERAGLPRVRFHDLRHTAATLLLEAGVHVKVVAERLGHATPSLVMNTYGHATERMQKDATAAMELVLSS